MDSLLGQSESVRTPAAMTARVLADAKRAFSNLADEAVLERFARDAVDELCRGSIKVTTFVPVTLSFMRFGHCPEFDSKAVRLLEVPAPKSHSWFRPELMAGKPGPSGWLLLSRLPRPIRLYLKPAFVPACS